MTGQAGMVFSLDTMRSVRNFNCRSSLYTTSSFAHDTSPVMERVHSGLNLGTQRTLTRIFSLATWQVGIIWTLTLDHIESDVICAMRHVT